MRRGWGEGVGCVKRKQLRGDREVQLAIEGVKDKPEKRKAKHASS